MNLKLSKRTKSILETLAYVLLGYLIAIGAHKGLSYAMGTDYPVVAVVSTSMEHHEENTYKTWFLDRGYNQTQMETEWLFRSGINKGDIVFVKGQSINETKKGDVIVYKMSNLEPIIHRVVRIENSELYTKGDNNMDPDQDDSIPPIKEQDLQGRAYFRVPLLGYVKIIFMKLTGSG